MPTPSPVTLRPAEAGDLPLLEEMLTAAAYWRPDGPAHTVAEVLADPRLAHYVAGWPRPGDLGVVAEAGEPVGAAWLRLFPADDPAYGWVADDVPELAVGVRAGWRGRGVGSLLLRALLARAGDAGLRAVSLSVEDGNPARRLYERLGFVEVGRSAGESTMLLRLP